jgi:hypothetical protein
MVRLWAIALFSGRDDGLSFEDAIARIPDAWAQAWIDWRRIVRPLRAPEDRIVQGYDASDRGFPSERILDALAPSAGRACGTRAQRAR